MVFLVFTYANNHIFAFGGVSTEHQFVEKLYFTGIYPHSADTDEDWSISQSEVQSFITAYSSNNNTATTEDGDITEGRITLREVMRVIYLYNNGGAYVGGQATVDGYDIAGVGDPAETHQTPVAEKPEEGTVGTGDGSLVVSSNADSGAGSLRDAIASR
jgi:hypothetical protein